MEFDERYYEGNSEDQYRTKRRKGLDLFLSVNDLTQFQREVVTVLLDPDSGPDEYATLLLMISDHAGNLESVNWKPRKAGGDMVYQPDHYARFPLEPTKFAMEYGLNWCEGNALKYLCRFPFKNGVEDLRKAMRYVEMLIKFLEGDKAWSA